MLTVINQELVGFPWNASIFLIRWTKRFQGLSRSLKALLPTGSAFIRLPVKGYKFNWRQKTSSLEVPSVIFSFPDPIPGGRCVLERLHRSPKARACSATWGREACKGKAEEGNPAARNQVLTNLEEKLKWESKLTNPPGMEQSRLHQLDLKDTIQLPRFMISTTLKGSFVCTPGTFTLFIS